MPSARDLGLTVGELPTGPLNRISDVAGVSVGHCTIDTPQYKTGVTVLRPHPGNPYTHRLPAGVFVLNGFGKSLGLMQIEELGQLESPILLTSTLNVGKVHDGAVEYLLGECQQEGVPLRSVNPVVCECNDGTLSDIGGRPVEGAHVLQALADTRADFAQGDVGAGKGMICHGLKGGIGSASRLITLGDVSYTLGVLALTNHGRLADLTIGGRHIGPDLAKAMEEQADAPDAGSCILVMATDLPLDSRQICRVLRRGSVGLARLGSYIGHGSGEVFVGFSTANGYDPREKLPVRAGLLFDDGSMDQVFRAMAESTEEAVLNSMLQAGAVTGYSGKVVRSLSEFTHLLRV